MKNLLKFMACALAMSFGLTACNSQSEDPHNPYAAGYNPKGSQLNTNHALVGKMYGVDGVVENNADAQGIVFAVSQDGKTAYLVAFTDAICMGKDAEVFDKDEYSYRTASGYFTSEKRWGNAIAFAYDTTYKTTTENGVTKTDTIVKSKGIIHDVDGQKNTDQIIACYTAEATKDTNFKKAMYSIYAAKACREYYRRQWGKNKEDGNGAGQDPIGAKWASTKGEWYLPSIEELGDLMKNKDKINNIYGNTPSDFVNEKFYMPIGGEENHAYWSSSEFNAQSAWYCLTRVDENAKKGEYYPGNKLYGYFQKSDKIHMFVRPIRKAPIK